MAVRPRNSCSSSDGDSSLHEVICSKKLDMNPIQPELPNTRDAGTQTFLELDPKSLLDENPDEIKTRTSLDDHLGTFSSEWDYKDRRQILEETRTFFNNFLVIERVYESDEKDDEEGECESCRSCSTCKAYRESSGSKKSSTKSDETKAVDEPERNPNEIEQENTVPEIIVHRPSFAIPARYKVDIEEIKERFHQGRGWCRYILGGLVFMLMVLLFALAFLGIDKMED